MSHKKRKESRKTNIKNSKKFIVSSKESKVHKRVSQLISFFMWGYSIAGIIIFLSPILGIKNEQLNKFKESFHFSDKIILECLFISLFVFVLSFFFLLSWKVYNLVKYGKLNRRRYRDITKDEEILALGLMDEKYYEKLDSNIVIFHENPIRDIL